LLTPVGFWSYARQDDDYSGGQLSELRALVGKAINLRRGEEVRLFQDTEAIAIGADWEATIESAIAQTTFFIPLITPRFLKSTHCRDEFKLFRRRMSAMGRDDLIFPVHYVDVERIDPAETVFGDELLVLRRQQWIDFRPFQYEDVKSGKVRRWADTLAASVLSAMTGARSPPATPARTPPASYSGQRVQAQPSRVLDDVQRYHAAAPSDARPQDDVRPRRRASAILTLSRYAVNFLSQLRGGFEWNRSGATFKTSIAAAVYLILILRHNNYQFKDVANQIFSDTGSISLLGSYLLILFMISLVGTKTIPAFIAQMFICYAVFVLIWPPLWEARSSWSGWIGIIFPFTIPFDEWIPIPDRLMSFLPLNWYANIRFIYYILLPIFASKQIYWFFQLK
jgi:hypothetical protein